MKKKKTNSGRPLAHGEKLEPLTISIRPDQKSYLEKLAKEKSAYQSALVRDMIDFWIKSNEHPIIEDLKDAQLLSVG